MSRKIASPVSGHLISCLVKTGDVIAAETEIGIVEAMKMHIPVVAEHSGRVAKWLVSENSSVVEGQPLIELAPV